MSSSKAKDDLHAKPYRLPPLSTGGAAAPSTPSSEARPKGSKPGPADVEEAEEKAPPPVQSPPGAAQSPLLPPPTPTNKRPLSVRRASGIPSGPGSRAPGTPKRKWIDIKASRPARNAVSPAMTDLARADQRESDVDVSSAAVQMGFLTVEDLQHELLLYYSLEEDQLRPVEVQLVSEVNEAELAGEELDFPKLAHQAVGKVMARDYAKQSAMSEREYLDAFKELHTLWLDREAFRCHAFVAQDYGLKEALQAVVAEREGHTIIMYRRLIWITVKPRSSPCRWVSIPGLVGLGIILAQGIFALYNVIAAENELGQNPIIEDPPESWIDYWNWPVEFDGLRTAVRWGRLLSVIPGVSAVMANMVFLCSSTHSWMLEHRGFLDTYPNRFMRFFHPFVIMTFICNVALLVVYWRDDHVNPESSHYYLVITSLLATYYLESHFFAYDTRYSLTSTVDAVKVLFVDLFTNWWLLLKTSVILLLFIVFLVLSLAVFIVLFPFKLMQWACSDVMDCLAPGGCLDLFYNAWMNIIYKVVEDYLV